MTSTTSTRLYDQARQKANQKRFNAAKLSVSDELYWYNNNTHWESLSRKEFRSIMVRMESITAQFYVFHDDYVYPSQSTAIKKYWADEWGCEYLPESGKWLNLYTNEFIESETEKKAKRDAKKALKDAKKALKEAKKAKEVKQTAQYTDEEEELYAQAAQQAQTQTQTQPQQEQAYDYDDWYDAEEEAYAEAYAKARAQEELKEQQEQQEKQEKQEKQEQQEQQEAEAYLLDQASYRIACQPVLYLEELTDVQGDPDWRAYIYYDARIRRYVFKGTRRSLRATSKKTIYPEIKLCFRSSRELARYLRSSTDAALNLSMFAMTSATVKDATFAELRALPFRGNKTELFGYDDTRPCYSTFVDYLCMLRDVDASHSNFAAF